MESPQTNEDRTAMDAAMDGLALVDERGTYTYANDAHAEIYGYSDPEAFVGEHWGMCYAERDVARFEDELMPIVAEDGQWRGEVTGTRRGGITFPQEVKLTAREEGGLVCAVRDISTRKQVEREITPTTNFLSALLENIPAGVLAEDSARNVKFANEEFCAIFDIPAPPEALVGNDCAEAAEAVKGLFVDAERFIANNDRSVDEGVAIVREELDLVDGRTLERSGTPVDVAEERDGHLWVYHDITDRKRNERTLATLHDATREMMAAEDPETVARIASETAADVLDLPLNAIHFHEPGRGLVPAVYSPTARDLLGEEVVLEPGSGVTWRAFETGTPEIHENVAASDGIVNTETPIRSELSLPLGEFGVLLLASTEIGDFDDSDVALAKVLAANTEAALDRTERAAQLKRQNAQLDEFAGVISHDLRNPLGVAQGYLELAREEGDPEDFARIVKAHDRMEAIIEDVLALARQGKTVGETRPILLATVAEYAWDNVETGAATFVCENSTSDRPIEADEGRLEELLENLFRNAIEHGGENVTVRVGRLDGSRAAGFFVEDDGPGIPTEEREAVFDHGFSTGEEGTGFGLSIVETIADAHGWQVAATESDDGGARFEVRL